jgi:putative ABC transport system permease protein
LNLVFNITLAFRAIRTNLLRSILTILIIGFGIMALVGILTGIEVIKAAVTSNFSSMGSNSFQVSSDILKQTKRKKGGVEISLTQGKNIRWEEAKAFKEQYQVPAKVSISLGAGGISTVSYGDAKTNPNIRILGIDDNYFKISDTKMAAGRDFSPYELQTGTYVCVLGNGIATKLFKTKWANAINKVVNLGGVKLRVVGVVETKGGNMFSSLDNVIMLPLELARSLYASGNTFDITVSVNDISRKQLATDEAEGLMRVIRKNKLGQASDFSVNQNDSLANMLLENIGAVNLSAIFIGLITLLGSVIGLMNIMLVSVAERTREIGVSKALGARNAAIKGQFLTESILISLLGGILGVLLGVLAGNAIGLAVGTSFVVPWLWISAGFSLCAAVGVLSGIYPAIKASRLDPIVALRYE